MDDAEFLEKLSSGKVVLTVDGYERLIDLLARYEKRIAVKDFALRFCRKNFEELQEQVNRGRTQPAFIIGVCKNGIDGIAMAEPKEKPAPDAEGKP